jgi:hypothetical protein
MITIYGKGFPDEERRNYTSIVYNNVITSMKTLAQQVGRYARVLPENEDALNYLLTEVKEEIVDEHVGSLIMRLWDDPGIRVAFEHKADFQLNDSAEYFFTKVHEIMQKGYVPTEQDVLRSRVRTTGIVENEFHIDRTIFKMFDVGGQRNERKKWIHCFDAVTAVIFVAAMSEYDQKLYEDENTNRLVEALNLFEEICNSPFFRKTAMILFLNKRDIFNNKIMKVNLSSYFPEYPGPDRDPITAQEWIREQFVSRNLTPGKIIYPHVTCATDTNNVAAVFNAVKETIIRKHLEQAGLLMS